MKTSPDSWPSIYDRPDKESLVPVRSESELRAGMTVVLKGCSECGGTDVLVLLKEEPRDAGPYYFCALGETHDCRRWRLGNDCTDSDIPCCFAVAIKRGVLFRLETGIDEEADARAMEADRVRAALMAGFRLARGEAVRS